VAVDTWQRITELLRAGAGAVVGSMSLTGGQVLARGPQTVSSSWALAFGDFGFLFLLLSGMDHGPWAGPHPLSSVCSCLPSCVSDRWVNDQIYDDPQMISEQSAR
jgi:hypothetical protein